MSPLQFRRAWPWLALAGLVLLTWWAYAPGLRGGFLFDDFNNLNALGTTGPIDNWAAFWRYVTSGTADPTGRPLALLSFLVDARNWPADPAPFLRTNLLLHLANGTLLFALLRGLGNAMRVQPRANAAAALLGAALWMLHPLFVSTTLYVVQREAMLPATFTLLGLLAFVHGRQRLQLSAGTQGWKTITWGVALGTLLATLSKANGFLLPLLALVIESTVFNASAGAALPPAAMRRWRTTRGVLLVAPSLVAFLYVLGNAFLPKLPIARSWTLWQRLITEPRVLVDYLSLLVVPRSVSPGLFNEDYPVSQSLLHPAGTLPALLLVVALLWLGWHLRRRAPALSAALLFYFAGQLFESTLLPLELYFEHRNYLPAMLLFWPLGLAIARWNKPVVLRAALACVLVAACAATTWQRTTLWGQPQLLTRLWASQARGSSRAISTAASGEIAAGRPDIALAQLLPAWREHPHDLQIALNAIDAECAWRGLDRGSIAALAVSLQQGGKGALLVRQWLENSIGVAASGRCRGLTLDTVQAWLDAAARNPVLSEPNVQEKSMASLYGLLAMHRQQPERALRLFNRALAANVDPNVAAGQAAALAAHGDYGQALRHLELYDRLSSHAVTPKPWSGMPWIHARVLAWQGYWPREMTILRNKLHAELAHTPPQP